MNGIQFYLAKDVPGAGHTPCRFAVGAHSISQKQFWRDVPSFGGGKVAAPAVGGHFRVGSPGILVASRPMQCSAEEIKEEVWAEVHLNVGGAHVIDDSTCSSIPINPSAVTYMEPLLVNTAGSLKYRRMFTQLPNYSGHNTDLACMGVGRMKRRGAR